MRKEKKINKNKIIYTHGVYVESHLIQPLFFLCMIIFIHSFFFGLQFSSSFKYTKLIDPQKKKRRMAMDDEEEVKKDKLNFTSLK